MTISLNSLSPLTPYRSSSPQFPFVTAIQTLFILPHQFSFVSSLLSFSPIAYLVTLRVFSFRFGTLSYIIYFIALQHDIDIILLSPHLALRALLNSFTLTLRLSLLLTFRFRPCGLLDKVRPLSILLYSSTELHRVPKHSTTTLCMAISQVVNFTTCTDYWKSNFSTFFCTLSRINHFRRFSTPLYLLGFIGIIDKSLIYAFLSAHILMVKTVNRAVSSYDTAITTIICNNYLSIIYIRYK